MATLERRRRNVGSILGHACHHGHLVLGIEIEVATGRHVGRVRPEEAHGQEEWPRAVGGALRQDLLGSSRHQPVGVGRVRGRRGKPTECGPELTGPQRKDPGLFLEMIDAGGIEGRLPRGRVVVPGGTDARRDVVVVELADAGGEAAIPPEEFRQTRVPGDRLPEDLAVGEDAGGVGMKPGEHRVAAWAAEWKRTVGPVKPHAAGGEAVEVGRLGERVAIAAEHRVEVIGHDEQHVPRLGGLGGLGATGCRDREREEQEEQRSTAHGGVTPGSGRDVGACRHARRRWSPHRRPSRCCRGPASR